MFSGLTGLRDRVEAIAALAPVLDSHVSVNTVRTHMRHLYDKLGAHRRLEAIDRARTLGLLAPAPQRA